jgi:hypothetical protein
MTLGPALSGAALDGTSSKVGHATQEQILDTLRQMLQRLPAAPEVATDDV